MSATVPLRAHNQAHPEPSSTGQSRLGLGMFIVLLAQLMLVLDATVVTVAIPHIQTDLHFSSASLSWVLDGYMLAFGGLLLLGGRLGDVYGRRRVFWWGLAVFTVFSLVGGVAPTADVLIVSRILQGVGAAIASPSVLALLTTSAPTEHARHRALASFAAVSSGGGALGLVLGGFLTDVLSWRWTMFINVPIGLVVLALVPRLVKETPRRNDRFDTVGAVTATAGAMAIVWAFVQAPSHGWSSWQFIGGLVAGAVLLTVLGVTETRVSHPLLRLELLKDRHRVAVLVAMASVYGAMMGMWFILALYLENHLGYKPLVAGLCFLPMPASVFTLSRITPRLVARFGRLPLMVLGTAGMAVGIFRLSLLNADSHYFWGIFPVLFLMGISSGLMFMPFTATVLQGVPHEHAGAASGLLQTMQQLGGAIGLAAITSVYAAQSTGGFMHGMRMGLVLAGSLEVLALLAALTVAVRRREPKLALAV